MFTMDGQVRKPTGFEYAPQLCKPREFEFINMRENGKSEDL
jgi:hypothetical protein